MAPNTTNNSSTKAIDTTEKLTSVDEENGIDNSSSSVSVSVYNYAKRVLLAVNFFVETNRMEPFVAVYYITFKDWNPTNIGVVSLVMNMVMLVAQTPVGDILDKTTNKKMITAVSVLIAAITTTSVAWTSNFWIVLVAKAIEGLAATVFLPALTLLLFGIIQTKKEAPKFVAQTEVSNKIGSLLFTLLCGLMAYFLYPNIASIFYLLGGGGVVAAIFVLMIPSSAIDDNRARQLEEQQGEESDVSKSADEEKGVDDTVEMTSPDQEEDSKLAEGDYTDRRNCTLKHIAELRVQINLCVIEEEKEALQMALKLEVQHLERTNKEQETTTSIDQEEDSKNDLERTNKEQETSVRKFDNINDEKNEKDEIKAVSYMSLIKNKNIAMFAVLTFVYHLSNAGIVPLVAQHLAIGNEKTSMIFTSAVLLLFYFAQAITAQVMTKAVEKVDHKILLVLAHLVLPIRCGLIAIMITWWDNKYAICSTQLLDGVGAGIYDTMIPIVVSKLTVGTGRFGVTFGFIVTCWRIGHGFSYLLAEGIWHKFGAAAAFLSLGGIGIISLIILVFGVTIPTYEIEEPARRSIARTTSLVNLIDVDSKIDDNEPVQSMRQLAQTHSVKYLLS